MNKEILQVVDAVANEKGVSKPIIFSALECALATATKKRHGTDIEVRVAINQRTGDYEAFRRWQVIDSDVLELPQQQIRLTSARQQKPDIQVNEYIEEPIEPEGFNRIGAQMAKQVIVQKIREAERAQIVEAYQNREGELVSGVVKRVERGNVVLDLGGNVEALIPKDEMIPRESVRVGDRLRGYLQSVRPEPRGPQLFLSRATPELLIALFRLEIPEIGENLIEIMSAARDSGLRAKIAVRTKDSRIDPVGACVGMRGSRIQAITNELAGERVDIIVWDENPAQFVINAMSPVEVVSIMVDEEDHRMDVAVQEEQLAQAIGRNGQNVRLASQLTGWRLNVMTESQATRKNEAETLVLQKLFMTALEVDEEVSNILIHEGFSSLEEIAYVPLNEILEIKDFDEGMVKELRERAKDALLTRAIVKEEQQQPVVDKTDSTADLRTLPGMTDKLVQALADRGIVSKDDLAEQSVDDLIEVAGMDEALAAKLIMTARAHWFAKEN
jgi:N utilization substance protein A